jgi:Holliday junction resolvase
VSERTLTRQIIEALETMGAYVVKQHGSGLVRAGVPDLLICYHGRFIGLEVKTPKGRVSKIQEHELGRIHRAYGAAAVVRSVHEAVRLVREAVDA